MAIVNNFPITILKKKQKQNSRTEKMKQEYINRQKKHCDWYLKWFTFWTYFYLRVFHAESFYDRRVRLSISINQRESVCLFVCLSAF